MTVKKLQIKAGVNRENTRYTNEGGWYECDKIRFRQGNPEKIGGWVRNSANTFLGVCRSIWSWSLLSGERLLGVGTNLKFYIESGGSYNDVTPLRATESLTDPFETTASSAVVNVTDAAGGFSDGDFVTFSGASAVGGITIDGEYQIALQLDGTYNITHSSAATSSATGGGSVDAAYQINVGSEIGRPLTGYGAGYYGEGGYGEGGTSTEALRLWNQANFGEDIIAGPSMGALYIWDASGGVTSRMTLLSAEGGASNVPTQHNLLLVSDLSRFVFVFGCNVIGTSTYDPMLIRWSDQEDATNWTPAATNQSGDLRLSSGSEIKAVIQARQEILVLTDIAVYSLQYLGAPDGWGAQLLGENTSVASSKAVAYANGVAFWMGQDKFYIYDGTTKPLPCDLRRYIFTDLNADQYDQVFSGSNEAYHEIWWFYCSGGSTTVDRYVVYNYLENVWYYGTLTRTAWLDSASDGYPVAATYSNNLVLHENGADDVEGDSAQPIEAYVLSSQFDIDDGDRFAFIWRLLPDISFDGSNAVNPSVNITLYPLKSSGSGYNDPLSEGGNAVESVTRSATVPVSAYTGQINIRVRGRQLSLKIESSDLGVRWQSGAQRIDMRPDGRRG